MRVLATILFFVWMAYGASAQQHQQRHRFSVTGGVGWTHYINSLKIGTNAAFEDHLGGSFKILWEPEHRLALGLETGYFRFYSVEGTSPVNPRVVGRATLSVVPIMFNVRCRVVNNFYLSTGTGVAFLLSRIEGVGGSIDSSQTSLSNFQLSGLYLKPVSTHWRLGAEFKFLSVDKTEDDCLSLMAVASFLF
ncbi:MAG: hypothetical protein ACKOE6_08855 [Flammeovirgaceae bacterium]